MKRIGKLRKAMGEKTWAEYQKVRICLSSSYGGKRRSGEHVIRWRQKVKQKLIAYKGGKCEICGYDKPIPRAYAFHHRDPAKKDFGIAEKGNTRSFESLMREVDKCQLVCVRCHSEIHDAEDAKVRYETIVRHDLKRAELKQIVNEMWSKYGFVKKGSTLRCRQCNSNFIAKTNGQVFCNITCFSKHNTKCKNRPNKDELLELIEAKTPWVRIGKKFGVSDNAVKKWAKAYGILPQPRRYKYKTKTNCIAQQIDLTE